MFLHGAAGMKIYGDRISGNCLKVKWVCDHLALPYGWIDIDVVAGETRTADFLALNPFGQVPTVLFDDGRTLAQSNAIMRYLARDSRLIPSDAFAAAQMDAWMFWEQYSHEPYIAVRRFQMTYLGKPADALDPKLETRGYAALDIMERRLAEASYLAGDTLSLADIALVAYTRLAHEGGFDLARHGAIRHWIANVEAELGLATER
jgi:glutathione S-transferase